MKRSRVGEVWSEWDGLGTTAWQEVLVLSTEVTSFVERGHLCLNLETGAFRQVVESMNAIWEDTPKVCSPRDDDPLRFEETMHRRRSL